MLVFKPLLLSLLLLLPFKNILPETEAEEPCGCGVEILKWQMNMEMILERMTVSQDSIPPINEGIDTIEKITRKVASVKDGESKKHKKVIEAMPGLMSNLCKRITFADSLKFEIEDVKNDFMKFINMHSIYPHINDPAKKILPS